MINNLPSTHCLEPSLYLWHNLKHGFWRLTSFILREWWCNLHTKSVQCDYCYTVQLNIIASICIWFITYLNLLLSAKNTLMEECQLTSIVQFITRRPMQDWNYKSRIADWNDWVLDCRATSSCTEGHSSAAPGLPIKRTIQRLQIEKWNLLTEHTNSKNIWNMN